MTHTTALEEACGRGLKACHPDLMVMTLHACQVEHGHSYIPPDLLGFPGAPKRIQQHKQVSRSMAALSSSTVYSHCPLFNYICALQANLAV